MQVFCDKNGVGSHEAKLGYDDGPQDEVAHPWAIEFSSNLAERTRSDEFSLHKEEKGVERDGGYEDEGKGGEQHPSVVKSAQL